MHNAIRFLRRQAEDFLDILFPPVCGLCGFPANSEDRLVCRKCWDRIQVLEFPYCSSCKQPLYDSLRCPDCSPKPMIVFSLGYFDKHLQAVLHDLKYNGLKPLAIPLGQKLAALISEAGEELNIDLILPVPLHDSRQYKRGFNQAEEIGRALARELGIPLYDDILYVTRKTRQQARLPAHQREANVRGAFAVDDPRRKVEGKTVMIIDDVTTTGATLRENERVLKQASAAKIVAAVAATAR